MQTTRFDFDVISGPAPARPMPKPPVPAIPAHPAAAPQATAGDAAKPLSGQ